MTNDESINLLSSLSQAIDKLASFEKKDAKGNTISTDDVDVKSTLSTNEKNRWATISKILAKTFKDVLFPKGEEKVGRPEFRTKDKITKDVAMPPIFEKLKDNKFLKYLLGALALLAGIIAGFIAEIANLFKRLKLFIQGTKVGKLLEGIFKELKLKFLELIKLLRETKLGKFLENIFNELKLKFLELLKPLRETKFVKFIEDVLKEKVIKPISKLFETIGRVFRIFEGGKGPLLIALKFPRFFKFFESSIRIGFKLFQVGAKLGRLFGKLLGPVMAVFEVVVGLVQAFTDPKLSDKSFLQKIVTGLTQGLLNFFDFFEIFGLDLFKFETIRDRIEMIFKPFREGNWLEGINQILNQIVSVAISIPGKIVGWIIGWFDKDLGKKISDFFDRFDLGKFFTAISKRIGNIFEPIMNLFNYIGEKISPYITTILNLLGGPVMSAFELLKKAFEYIASLMKEIGSLASKFFSYIKNFFIMIFNSIKSLADKISKVPFMKKVGEELKAIASESQVTEMPTPVTAIKTENIVTGKQSSSPFENIVDSEKTFDMSSFNPESTFDSNTFSDFGSSLDELGQQNKITNRINVDQLREFKTLNQKFDTLIAQLLNSRNVINNVVTQTSSNSFPQATSVADMRNSHR